MQHVNVGGVRIGYSGAGSGPPLVMLHGAPADSRTWQWMLPDLSRDHTVIAWDAPGFGESSDIEDSFWSMLRIGRGVSSPRAVPGA